MKQEVMSIRDMYDDANWWSGLSRVEFGAELVELDIPSPSLTIRQPAVMPK